MGKLKLWTSQEDQLLSSISGQNLSKKWKKASQELKKNGYDRSDIECRQRYVNHLDPNVSKGNWTQQELQTLFQKYNQYGNKWFLIQKHLPGRTQTKIKNYFYGSIRYLLKIIIKTVTNNKAGFVNDIKTDILLDMYQGRNSFHGNTIVKQTINRLDHKVDKKMTEIYVQQNFDMFQNFAKQLFQKKNSISTDGLKEEDGVLFEESSDEIQPIRTLVQIKQAKEQSQPIKIVCSVSGIANDRLSELEYLSRMTKMHYDWFLFYQKAHEALLEKISPQKMERTTKESA